MMRVMKLAKRIKTTVKEKHLETNLGHPPLADLMKNSPLLSKVMMTKLSHIIRSNYHCNQLQISRQTKVKYSLMKT